MERNNHKKRCDICNVEISQSNWSKHLNTKKHKNNQNSNEVSHNEPERNIQKHCGICNVQYEVSENEWKQHLKSPTHKNNTKLLQDKLKEKVKSFKIIKQRKRYFNDIDFETDDYIAKKSEEA
jgi:hypothetical protein